MKSVRRLSINAARLTLVLGLLISQLALGQQGRVVTVLQRGRPAPSPATKGTSSSPVTPVHPTDPTAQPRLRSIFGRTFDTNPKTNINASSIVLPLGNDDVVRYDFQNGLVFPYYNTIYTSIFISANGFVTFGQPAFDVAPNLVSFITGPPRIAPFWDDLNPGLAGSVILSQIGSDILLIEWSGVADATEAVVKADTFALAMARNGAIEYIYGDVASASGFVGFTAGNSLFATAQKIDFGSLASAPNGINTALPIVFESFTTSSGADIRNSAITLFDTNKRTDPGMQSIIRPSTLGSMRASQTIFIEDPLGRLTKTAAVRIDGKAVKFTFTSAKGLSVAVPTTVLSVVGTHLVDVDFSTGVNYVTGVPLEVKSDSILLTSVTPNAVQVNDTNVKVTIDGFGFMTGVKVIISDFSRGINKTVTPTLNISPIAQLGTSGTQLTFTLPSVFLSNPADLFFSVVNVGNRTAISTEDFRTHLFVVRSPVFAVKQ